MLLGSPPAVPRFRLGSSGQQGSVWRSGAGVARRPGDDASTTWTADALGRLPVSGPPLGHQRVDRLDGVDALLPRRRDSQPLQTLLRQAADGRVEGVG